MARVTTRRMRSSRPAAGTVEKNPATPATVMSSRSATCWPATPRPDRRRWRSLLAEARSHAAGTADG
jgi:hypothetical protein